jgi:hypothetical protein
MTTLLSALHNYKIETIHRSWVFFNFLNLVDNDTQDAVVGI